ncbi:MAG: hypothetical protein EXS38_02615 [Opitutus sp.]|nr:hypothetical protein [Opitutus sp.]
MKSIATLFAVVLFTGLPAFAAAEKSAPKESAKEESFTGWAQCAKCALGLAPACQNALVVTKNGKDETFFLTQNPVSQDFHSNVCSGQVEVTVTGVASGPAGEREIVASKIEAVKKK